MGALRLSRRAWAWLALAGVVSAVCGMTVRPHPRDTADITRAVEPPPSLSRPASTDPTAAELTTPPAASTPTTAVAPPTRRPVAATTKQSPPPPTHVAAPAPVPAADGLGDRIVADARRYLGVPYLWGGISTGGMDCSGLVWRVMHDIGVTSVPRTADQQMHWTTRITRTQAQPGDLVFGVTGGWAHHVGIVVGPGLMIDAPDFGLTVGVHAFYADSTTFGRVPNP